MDPIPTNLHHHVGRRCCWSHGPSSLQRHNWLQMTLRRLPGSYAPLIPAVPIAAYYTRNQRLHLNQAMLSYTWGTQQSRSWISFLDRPSATSPRQLLNHLRGLYATEQLPCLSQNCRDPHRSRVWPRLAAMWWSALIEQASATEPLPAVKLGVCSQGYETMSPWMDFDRFWRPSIEPVLAPPRASEQQHLQSEEQITRRTAIAELNMQLSPDLLGHHAPTILYQLMIKSSINT